MCVIPADLRSHSHDEQDASMIMSLPCSDNPQSTPPIPALQRQIAARPVPVKLARPAPALWIRPSSLTRGIGVVISHWTPNAAIWTLYPAADLLLLALNVIMFEFLDKHEL